MASNSKRRRRVLGASCILAALIIAGSSFAWFTSKDEVTNRLSASSNYGVAFAEDFTPPENWLPGQEVNKDVGVVNTGNVDAYVRAWLEGEMNIVKEKSESTTKFTGNSPTFTTTALKDVADPSLTAAGLKKLSADGATYYKLLSTTERANSAINGTNAAVNDYDYSEVKAVQAGGWLAFASTDAAFTFSPEQEYEYVNTSDQNVVAAAETPIASGSIKNTWTAGVGLAIDSDTFTPTAPGLYIFRRNVNENATTAGNYDYEYSGYYYDGTNYYALKNKTDFDLDDNDTYSDFAIDTDKLNISYDKTGTAAFPVISVVPNGVELYEAERINVKNTNLTWKYTAPNTTDGTQGKMSATYGTGDTAIVVDVALSNIKGATAIAGTDYVSTDTSESWTVLGATSDDTADDQKATFYYNNDVEEGDTTKNLVDSVTLSSDTKKQAYVAFDFDLNLKLESVQVTVDNTGNETVEAAQAEFAGGKAPTKIKATDGVTDGGTPPEAGALTWTAATT